MITLLSGKCAHLLFYLPVEVLCRLQLLLDGSDRNIVVGFLFHGKLWNATIARGRSVWIVSKTKEKRDSNDTDNRYLRESELVVGLSGIVTDAGIERIFFSAYNSKRSRFLFIDLETNINIDKHRASQSQDGYWHPC